MAAYKTGAFVHNFQISYPIIFLETSLKWIPCSKSGAQKSEPHRAAQTHIGTVWLYKPPRAHPYLLFLYHPLTQELVRYFCSCKMFSTA